uniref:LOW QUALITY PROTEIN: centromere protein J-like n=1 Tax=Odobenus rosmarus divergens TaxID=9708 RepID=UPI00063CB052|nr:PREDICTED: LOW QUALITY PROTEIN: centromere protein J-like [Odobenus rosmarus divergens]
MSHPSTPQEALSISHSTYVYIGETQGRGSSSCQCARKSLICFWVRPQPCFSKDPVPSRAEEEEVREPPARVEKPLPGLCLPVQSHELEQEQENGRFYRCSGRCQEHSGGSLRPLWEPGLQGSLPSGPTPPLELLGKRMLTAEEPMEPAETGCLEEGGGPGADPEDTAVLSGEDGQAEQMLSQRLQQQVTRLHEAFRSQESRWAAAQRQLQSQMDALSRQNQELRDGLKALGLLRLGAREADSAALGTRRKPDALATRQSSRSLQEPSGLNPPEPTVVVVRLKEDRPAAEENGMRSLPCMGPEGRLLTPEQTDGSAHSLLATAKPQNPPVDPGPSHMDAEIKQGDKEEETRPPAGEVAQALGDGREAITFLKGTGKDGGAGKKTTVLRFLNGDVKKILPDQRVVYYYADAQIMRTTYPSGLDIVRFPDKQTEKYHPDGSKEIVFPDGTVKHLSDGCEETVFPDGTALRVERSV